MRSTASMALLMLALLVPRADAYMGTGTLTGTSKLHVSRCGTYRAAFSAVFVVAADGTWTADLTAEDASFAGTSTPMGRADRKIGMALDAPSTAAFIASVEDDIAAFCELASPTITSSTPKRLTLALNRKRTRAKLVVRYRLVGTADGESGRATYKLVARGPWTPG